jgi:F0F1-type ATP synthase membrane subunit c/vacuolar-type H+-ATPase subunit K
MRKLVSLTWVELLVQVLQLSVLVLVSVKLVEAIARQPEASNDIRANMILTAAFVEGVALFAVIAGLLAVLKS